MTIATVASFLKNQLPDAVVTLSAYSATTTVTVGEIAPLFNVTPLAVIATKYTQGGLNMRASPVVGPNLIKTLSNGTTVEVTNASVTPLVPSDGHKWVYVRAAGAMGYVAGEMLSDTPGTIPPPAPVPAPTPALIPGGIGLHIGSGGAGQYNAWASTYAAKKQLAIATVVDNVGLANSIIASGQARIVVARAFSPNGDDGKTVPSDPALATAFAQSWFNQRFSLFNGLSKKAYVQIANEWSWNPGHDAFWYEIITLLHNAGYKCLFGAYAVGQPEPAQWLAMAGSLRLCAQYGGLVGLHIYSAAGTAPGEISTDAPDYEYRPIRLYQAVPADCRPQLVFPEFGNVFGGTTKVSGADFVSFSRKVLNAYQAVSIPEIKNPAMAAWTLDTFKPWQNASIVNDLADIATI